MPSARLRNKGGPGKSEGRSASRRRAAKLSLLTARDGRQEIIDGHLRRRFPATVFLSLNVPGERKDRPGCDDLFEWAEGALKAAFPTMRNRRSGRDALGPFAVMRVGGDAVDVKRICVGVEESGPHGRLADLDVYDSGGRRIGRDGLGLPPRRCLVCDRPAAECIRAGRHSGREISEAADKLLAPLCAAAIWPVSAGTHDSAR
jgi:holo-ACP synthase CitX